MHWSWLLPHQIEGSPPAPTPPLTPTPTPTPQKVSKATNICSAQPKLTQCETVYDHPAFRSPHIELSMGSDLKTISMPFWCPWKLNCSHFCLFCWYRSFNSHKYLWFSVITSTAAYRYRKSTILKCIMSTISIFSLLSSYISHFRVCPAFMPSWRYYATTYHKDTAQPPVDYYLH